jgi:hypothetical protein
MINSNEMCELSDNELESVAAGGVLNVIWQAIKLVGGNAVWDGIKGEGNGEGFVATMAGKLQGKT